jgi:SAM-dependent methyltransferase
MTKARYIHDTNVHNTKAAEVIVPLILEKYKINSVVDVGCGIGTWLTVFDNYGIEYIGIDGDFVDRSLLQIHKDNFKCFDLNHRFSLNKRFDLAICLEVAEHLEVKSARLFIETLCSLSDLIIFSAAIPCQGGQNHLNEQYPEYWLSIFESQGYYLIDDIKPQIWGNPNIEWWYQQNIMIIKNTSKNEKRQLYFSIHPELYKIKIEEIRKLNTNYQSIIRARISVLCAFKILLKALINSLRLR